ncbi:hypothetical protein CAPTEDRAFT_222727 [Capitella teleta]|uniref:Sulfotransferase domain-containing protein n=1 Tax=Capitella teleta TaxID=283909 RepID=R7T9P3_CAPTE|nr:hypothetical protein CAPTEDRAFT_222727 [Capitella teleta]|eukprot:ELT90468.1 hypothetical protein CAPTEDRAFT_222727 [Capitella teleta]
MEQPSAILHCSSTFAPFPLSCSELQGDEAEMNTQSGSWKALCFVFISFVVGLSCWRSGWVRQSAAPEFFRVDASRTEQDTETLISFEDYSNVRKASNDSEEWINLINVKPPEFLPTFKNPCWRDNSTRLRCLPYFYIAGQPKCGTTDLFHSLVLHPQIVMPVAKEPHWWARGRFGVKSLQSFKSYVKMFAPLVTELVSGHRTDLVTGEASASTLWDNRVWKHFPENQGLSEPRMLIAQHLHHFQPQAKIIVIIRNPVDRTFSDYLYFGKGGEGVDDFHRKVQLGIDHFNDCVNNHTEDACVYLCVNHSRLSLGLYVFFLEHWMREFPRNQIFVVRLEDYSADKKRSLRDIAQFLDLAAYLQLHGLRMCSTATALNVSGTDVTRKTRKLEKCGMILEDCSPNSSTHTMSGYLVSLTTNGSYGDRYILLIAFPFIVHDWMCLM